jgi:hypothetical protein
VKIHIQSKKNLYEEKKDRINGCTTGVGAFKACIRIWEENPNDVKI